MATKKHDGNGYGGIVSVYGHNFVQKDGYYQINWPLIEVKGANINGTWSIHGTCNQNKGGYVQNGCNTICRALSSARHVAWNYCAATFPETAKKLASRCT